MALAKEDIEEIKELIVAVMAERRPETLGNNVRYALKIRERIVRVEEELKHTSAQIDARRIQADGKAF